MNHDRLFKELLTTFFAEFIDLFLPKVACELDRGSIQFVDKEVFTDIGSGDRHEVDLLAKVRLRNAEAFILIHVENQSSWQADFSQRMFRYFSLIHGKYALPVYPIALFSFDRPLATAPDSYQLQLFDLPVLRFQFHMIQLNTLNWRQFVNRPNPVASALMVKMKIEPADRPRVKLECLRMLATLKLNPAKARLIGVFMYSYLHLTSEVAKGYNDSMQELVPIEKDFDEEIKQELVRLLRAEFLVDVLGRRFGAINTELTESSYDLTAVQAGDLATASFGFRTVDDIKEWITKLAT